MNPGALDPREPPHGDFVAYVEKIEREQIARAMQPHRLPQLSTGERAGTDASSDNDRRTLSANEAQRLLQTLKAKSNDGEAPPRGVIIGVALGLVLIAFGLLAEGGFVLVILGAVLLWHNLRKLRRSPGNVAGSPQQQVDHTFGQTSGVARRRPGS